MKKAVIIDYESGNLHSTQKSFEKIGKETGHIVSVSSNPKDLDDADHIILPGVGAFADCMTGLKAIEGMIESLSSNVIDNRKPFLGICVGMQLLAKQGLEHGTHNGLGWIDATVMPIPNSDDKLKIPHMGWNNLKVIGDSTLVENLDESSHAYFVHSYYMDVNEDNVVVATTDYGNDITAIVSKGNIHGTQFHPEKSQETGFAIIKNFLNTE